jgi:hypothetical protein
MFSCMCVCLCVCIMQPRALCLLPGVRTCMCACVCVSRYMCILARKEDMQTTKKKDEKIGAFLRVGICEKGVWHEIDGWSRL